ncbi:hypothetical protein BDW02DRAFT_603540 [Decorospora gaudefroyi]|uniref:Uncharacterized protein n=1 Tax=Decorospora gaudefroyi TaxID=184978 RepID=A0A6A5JY22_9PLEO|nr:hypothetical protein BDW02DRAFT_603540 [Decorospora gaudefroyi]
MVNYYRVLAKPVSNSALTKLFNKAMRPASGYLDWIVREQQAGLYETDFEWAADDLTLTGITLQCEIFPELNADGLIRNMPVEGVPFADLAKGVARYPSITAGDGHDLTRCVQYVVAHPEKEYIFPRDFEKLIEKLGGALPVSPKHTDAAVFARWKSKRSRQGENASDIEDFMDVVEPEYEASDDGYDAVEDLDESDYVPNHYIAHNPQANHNHLPTFSQLLNNFGAAAQEDPTDPLQLPAFVDEQIKFPDLPSCYSAYHPSFPQPPVSYQNHVNLMGHNNYNVSSFEDIAYTPSAPEAHQFDLGHSSEYLREMDVEHVEPGGPREYTAPLGIRHLNPSDFTRFAPLSHAADSSSGFEAPGPAATFQSSSFTLIDPQMLDEDTLREEVSQMARDLLYNDLFFGYS